MKLTATNHLSTTEVVLVKPAAAGQERGALRFVANDFAQHATANIARVLQLVWPALDQLAVIIEFATLQAVFCYACTVSP